MNKVRKEILLPLFIDTSVVTVLAIFISSIEGCWKAILGPLAYYVVQFSGKEKTEWWQIFAVVLVCVFLILPEVVKDGLLRRILFHLGLFVWFIFGLSYLMAWK